ncbi:MAG TPA: hypothetical protein VGT98_13305, partial [Candidatus Elarobacter sp.]|nr:hypothetical protein [Candidatus Elarobacter sp.]
MTSSTREATVASSGTHGTAEWFDALLSTVASAPDFSTAARFLVAQFADAAGAGRGYALMLDAASGRLAPVATMGYDEHDAPASHLLDDLTDPLVLGALSMLPVCCARPPRGHHAPASPFIAIPFP